jgi:hypothetical protein
VDLSPEDYCRQVESYLCRKNDGHLIRIVGPAFEQVCGWASRGVPIKIACHGIDRYFERYYAKGPRRRPVRIEFCEADVLDVFDEWRRAVGVPAPAPLDDADGDGGDAGARALPARHATLPAHLDRVIARLTALRAGPERTLDDVLDAAVRELDAARASAKSLRGDARQAFLDRLAVMDRMLLDAARRQCDAATLGQLQTEADVELAAFRDRMPRDAYEQATRACVDRLIRDRARLPMVAFD